MRAFALRVRADAGGYYSHARGRVVGDPFPSHDEAEQVRRAMPNGAEFETVEQRKRALCTFDDCHVGCTVWPCEEDA